MSWECHLFFFSKLFWNVVPEEYSFIQQIQKEIDWGRTAFLSAIRQTSFVLTNVNLQTRYTCNHELYFSSPRGQTWATFLTPESPSPRKGRISVDFVDAVSEYRRDSVDEFSYESNPTVTSVENLDQGTILRWVDLLFWLPVKVSLILTFQLENTRTTCLLQRWCHALRSRDWIFYSCNSLHGDHQSVQNRRKSLQNGKWQISWSRPVPTNRWCWYTRKEWVVVHIFTTEEIPIFLGLNQIFCLWKKMWRHSFVARKVSITAYIWNTKVVF